jgi:hypothetical protein
VRLAIWTIPSATLLRYVDRRVGKVLPGQGSGAWSVARIGWAVRAVSRRMPRSTCLVEALAVQLLLAHHGHRSDLRVGVARGVDRRFMAHAWVEVDGGIVVGAGTGMSYTPLPDLRQILR